MNEEMIHIRQQHVLADDWGTLTKYEFEFLRSDGVWQNQTREAYDRGNGATCLLYDPTQDTVLLTRQFRLPVYLNGGITSFVETPAGLLEGKDPAERMRAELVEETGYSVSKLTDLYNVYMSPGSVTEYLAFFIGTYSSADKVAQGGGQADEGEDIEVLHVRFDEALEMIARGDIRDAKTIILLQNHALSRGDARP